MNNLLGLISLVLAGIFWGVALGPVIGAAIFFTVLCGYCVSTDIANALMKTIADCTNAITSKMK